MNDKKEKIDLSSFSWCHFCVIKDKNENFTVQYTAICKTDYPILRQQKKEKKTEKKSKRGHFFC